MEFLNHLVPADFMPHGYCYLWDPWIVWLHAVSDGLIAASYYCIPIVLVYFIHKNRDLPFNRFFWMFGTFILACGTTHLMEVWNIWHGTYLLAGVIKAVTAVVSLVTAATLIPLVPRVISLPSRIHLQEINRNLERELAEHKQIEVTIETPLRRWASVGFAVAILLTGLLGFLSWRNTQQAAKDSDSVSHTHEVITTLETTFRHLVDVESGSRGFALSGHQTFLDPYEAGRRALGADLDALRRLTTDNPNQKRRLEVLAEQVNARVKSAEERVASRRNTGTIPTAPQLEWGKQIMDAPRVTFEGMEAEEGRLLEERNQHTRAGRRLTTFVTTLGSTLGVVFLATAGLSVSRQIGVSARARALVIEINADLEQRVAQRTAALGESEGRLASVIQSAMDSIITVDEEQRILLFNAAAERMFRCPAAEALEQPLDRFIPQRFRAAHAGHMKRFGEAGVTTRALGAVDALWGVRADGEEFQIEASISQIEVAGKKLLTVILRDITERRRAEEARERLAAIVDSSDDAIIGKALDGTITAWNRGAEKVFGYPSAEVLGKPMLVLFPPELVNEESDILARISHGESVEHFETVRLRKDGTRIDVSVTISPIWDRSGAVVGASKIARDITERRRAEEERREQAQVLNSAQVFVRDMQSRVVFWPKGAEKLYGFTSQEALGIVSHQLFHTQFPEPLETIEKKLFETGVWEGELIHTKRDGSVITVSSAWALHRDNQGQPARILETNIDVTERNQAEDALRQIDARRKFALETANLGDWELDLTTLQATRSLLHDQIFGYQSLLPEWNFDIFLGHVHPDDRERVRDDFQGCARQGKRWEFECRIVCPNGDIRWIWACGDYYRDSTADATRMFGIVKDITTRKNIENALASQAEELSHQAGELLCSQRALESQKLMLQSVLDSMAEGLAATDEQGKFIIWNPAAEKILGMGAVNLPSQDWTQHYGLYLPDGVTPFPPDQIPLVRAIRGETSLTEMFVRNPEVAEGAWVEVSAGPLKDIGGVVRGGVAAFRDITQKKTAEQEIHRLNEELEHRVVERTAQLEEANQELESFTYSVAHDLRAPLRHIAGFSGILVEEFSPSLDAQAQSYLQRIQDGARKMGELVDELLNLARVGRQTPNLQVAGLNSIVKEVIGILQPEMEGRQVEWKIAALPFVECDPTLVMQVFQNLISNALKYSRPRPLAVIEIGQILESGRPAIFVRDNGVGFSMKYADKLFGVFQRLHRSEDFEGTGVGLATVQRIIKKHQGKVWAEAELDQGATFYFTLGSLQPDEAKGPTLALGARS